MPGDKVAIVAPGRRVQPPDIGHAINTLSQWELQVIPGRNVFSNSHPYLAGSDDERFRDLQDAISNPGIRAIISARGGYGTTRILDRLDLSPLHASPKWIAGFSDITALHLKLYRHGFMSAHGIMPILFQRNDAGESIASLKKVLFEGTFGIHAEAVASNRTGSAQGTLIGGNLSLIADSLGTSSEPDTSGCILVIEEIDEYRYRLDRMMTQLKRAGKLRNLKGLAVGHMTTIKDPELPFGETIYDIINRAVADYDYPVAFHVPTGHEEPNLAWIHGGYAHMSVTEQGTEISSATALL